MRLSRQPDVRIMHGDGTFATVAKFDDPGEPTDYVKGLLFVGYDPDTLHTTWTEGVRVDTQALNDDYTVLLKVARAFNDLPFIMD